MTRTERLKSPSTVRAFQPFDSLDLRTSAIARCTSAVIPPCGLHEEQGP